MDILCCDKTGTLTMDEVGGNATARLVAALHLPMLLHADDGQGGRAGQGCLSCCDG